MWKCVSLMDHSCTVVTLECSSTKRIPFWVELVSKVSNPKYYVIMRHEGIYLEIRCYYDTALFPLGDKHYPISDILRLFMSIWSLGKVIDILHTLTTVPGDWQLQSVWRVSRWVSSSSSCSQGTSMFQRQTQEFHDIIHWHIRIPRGCQVPGCDALMWVSSWHKSPYSSNLHWSQKAAIMITWMVLLLLALASLIPWCTCM